MCSKVQRWLAQCKIAQDRSEVNNGIVVFSGILEDIWGNRFLVHFPYALKVKPIDLGGETPFSLGNFDRDIKKKRENDFGWRGGRQSLK